MVTSRSTPPPSSAKARSPRESSWRSPSGSPSRHAPVAGSSDGVGAPEADELLVPVLSASRRRRGHPSSCCGSGHPRLGRDPNTSLPCRQDHIPTPRGGRAPWVSVPGCWTRRTGPLLMSARLYRARRRGTPDRSRPLDPPRPDLGPDVVGAAIASTKPSRSPARNASVPSSQASSSTGSGTSRSSAAVTFSGRGVSAVPATRCSSPRRHRGRRRGRPPAARAVRRAPAPRPAARRAIHAPVVVDDDLDDPRLGGDEQLRAGRSAATQSAARPSSACDVDHRARPRAAGRCAPAARPTRTRPRSISPVGDERAARRAGRRLSCTCVDHAVVLAAEPGGGRAPRHRARRGRDSSTAGTPCGARPGARSTATSAPVAPTSMTGTHTSTAASKPGRLGNQISSTRPARADRVAHPGRVAGAEDRLRLEQRDACHPAPPRSHAAQQEQARRCPCRPARRRRTARAAARRRRRRGPCRRRAG